MVVYTVDKWYKQYELFAGIFQRVCVIKLTHKPAQGCMAGGLDPGGLFRDQQTHFQPVRR
jgi:hypothetical protein